VNKPWTVIIVGGGFGGLRAAQALKSELVDVTLIDRRNYHLFQPLLYQVATGLLSPGQISAPLRVEPPKKYPCPPGFSGGCRPIRHKILYAFEVAERILDPVQRRAWLTFVSARIEVGAHQNF
jgi:flavin-dependent dehydrogenase